MSILESTAVLAFAMGLLSACSLPLGTLTTKVWVPGDRMIAVLMAFGGGALLAALTIDLVGSALEKGHFYTLAVGCILGGILFRVLNEMLNAKGGFLRKSSTVIHYMQRRQRERFRHALDHLHRVEFFAGLPKDVVHDLAGCVTTLELARGTTLYRQYDPAERMYIIREGAVELRDPLREMSVMQALGPDDAFGQMGFITGAPRATFAIATADTKLWVLPKAGFEAALATSQAFAERIDAFVHSDKVAAYLRDHQGLSEADVRHWIDQAQQALGRGEALPVAVKIDRSDETFLSVADHIGRFPLFQGLPEEELRLVAERLIRKHHTRGETLFHQGEAAERLYVVDHGEVALINPSDPRRRPVRVGPEEAFGGFSFLTGACHTVSAVVSADTTLWVWRKRDFDDLLSRLPGLKARVQSLLSRDDMASYLEVRQKFDAERAARWTRKAIKSIDTSHVIPSAAEMAGQAKQHAGAPLAIWLGILLDGIPEALVIGSSLLVGHGVSYSLIAGLFLSNFPEALSSSIGMRQQGMPFGRVLLMWTSLMVITGIFASVGAVFFVGAPPHLFSVVEGIAAGAMLTMIAETMMPEAYYKGGSVVGLSTLAGFLVAIMFTTFE